MKKKKNNGIKTSSFIIAAGIIVLIVFAFVTVINLLPNYLLITISIILFL